jgi:hypothetical protein
LARDAERAKVIIRYGKRVACRNLLKMMQICRRWLLRCFSRTSNESQHNSMPPQQRTIPIQLLTASIAMLFQRFRPKVTLPGDERFPIFAPILLAFWFPSHFSRHKGGHLLECTPKANSLGRTQETPRLRLKVFEDSVSIHQPRFPTRRNVYS